jgi:hypothetical protein
MPSKQLTRAEFTLLAAGVAVIVGSFAPFYTAGSASVNAWDNFPGLSPLSLYPVFAGVASAGVIALRHFANGQLAVRRGAYTWEQIHLLLGLFALLVMVGFFFTDHAGNGLGWGFWLLFAGSIALFVGALMLTRERSGPHGYV